MVRHTEKSEDDRILWAALKSGDRNALNEIFRLHYLSLYHYGVKLCHNESLVKDCLQDLFVYIFENRENLSDVKVIRYYLFKAFRRRLLDQLQKNRRWALRDHQSLEVYLSPYEIEVDDPEYSGRKRELLTRMINKLPARQKELIYLRYYKEVPLDEIANILSMSYRSVVSTLYKAMTRLRQDEPILRKLEYFLFPIMLCCLV